MGCCQGKEEDAEEKDKAKSKFSGDLYFDDRGMLRARPPEDPHFDREVEAQRVFRADSLASDLASDPVRDELATLEKAEDAGEKGGEEEENTVETVWYIIPSSWLESWVAFVREDRVRPSAIRNEMLLDKTEDGRWAQNRGLSAASKLSKGDYRRVSGAVWREFVDLYPGSGPEITVVGNETDWTIATDKKVGS